MRRQLTTRRVRRLRRILKSIRCPKARNRIRCNFRFDQHYDGRDWYYCERCGMPSSHGVTP